MIQEMGRKARASARLIALAATTQKNETLQKLADRLWSARERILTANQVDVRAGIQAGLVPAMLDRLTLTEDRLLGILADLRRVAAMPYPVG
jgi:glutamate-5-semialdehyde dehydrogenase